MTLEEQAKGKTTEQRWSEETTRNEESAEQIPLLLANQEPASEPHLELL